MNKLRIPSHFTEILKQNSAIHGAVMLSLSEFEPWIADNKLPFFPEYTDHGPDHICEVFITAEALIRDEAWPHVTPSDVAVLVLAILLHDCAMHLSEDGFVSLLKNEKWSKPFSQIDSVSWPTLWSDFLREAARFDGRQLKKIFGDTQPIRPPPLNANDMTKRDRLLIGEFLRRHHPRLAHEIALAGIPGPTGTPLRLQGLDPKIADHAGLVARSHGMDLRLAVGQLPIDDRRESRGAHVPFLMATLRIADYLQIQTERAPMKLLHVSALRSPVSLGEWKKHEAIVNIHPWHDDPESIFVKAEPQDANTYVGLHRLFSSIQEELDDVWAVLGEVYGRISGLNQLGVTLRRIRSNLDEERVFEKTVNYVPGQAAFQTANADLLKLLIGPLYGNDPSIGIRELIQNAVDACRELDDYLAQKSIPMPDLATQDADVVIEIERNIDGTGWITVSDRGIGMTPEVIKKYFLTAGASFRNSEIWRKQHAFSDGSSRILRSGRFGIGVLAAFLLGERIDVSTRHVSQVNGILFSASIDDETIELRYTQRTVGTTVRTRVLDKGVLDAMEGLRDWQWDWYCLDKPSVARILEISFSDPQRGNTKLRQRFNIPSANGELDHRWRRISHEKFLDIQWSYWAEKADEDMLILSCNGIRVLLGSKYSFYREPPLSDVQPRRFSYPHNTIRTSPHIGFPSPCVSVFDPDGNLPLTLQRTSLAIDKYPFHDELYDDVCRDFIAYLIVNFPSQTQTPDIKLDWFSYPVWTEDDATAPWFPLWLTQNGWSVVDAWTLARSALKKVVMPSNINTSGMASLIKDKDSGLIPFASTSPTHYHNWIRAMLAPGSYTSCGPADILRAQGRRIIIPQGVYKTLRASKIISRQLWEMNDEETVLDDWVILRAGQCPSLPMTTRNFTQTRPEGGFEGFSEWYLSGNEAHMEPDNLSRMGRVWADLIGQPLIPFAPGKRRVILEKANKKLKTHIEAHRILTKKT